MTWFVRIATALAATLALAACSASGTVNDGYDPDSPGARHGEACGQHPPSPYCGITRE